jgi:ectoine hydroxylase-related dioxygenase (phytanoyl-CoA dioxygenase family)
MRVMATSPRILDGGAAPERLHEALQADGYAIVRGALSGPDVDALVAELEAAAGGGAARRRGEVYAVRNLLEEVPAVARLASSTVLQSLAEASLGAEAVAVKGTLFDKRPEANWLVPWHQDLTIAVRERVQVEGFGPWSHKSGVPHVQPPATVLERMVAIRVHLDECGAENGALRVIPGSHRPGRLSDSQIVEWRERVPAVLCEVPRGGVLMMHPLLLHASSAAASPSHRRVVHLEYAAGPLPGGLCWRSAPSGPGTGRHTAAADAHGATMALAAQVPHATDPRD